MVRSTAIKILASIMTDIKPAIVFDRGMAASYDKMNAVFAPMRSLLNFVIRAIFAELPINARVLYIGVAQN
jgi:hypothetical protein